MELLSPTEMLDDIITSMCNTTHALYGSVYIDFSDSLHHVYSNIPEDQQYVKESRDVTLSFTSDLKERTIKNLILYFLPLRLGKQSIACIVLYFPKTKLDHVALIKSVNQLLLTYSVILVRNQIHDSLAKTSHDMFISTAGHELKTPLTTLKLYADLIQREINTKKPIPSSWGEKLYKQTTVLEQLILSFLSFSKQKQFTNNNIPYVFLDLLDDTLAINSFLFPHHTFKRTPSHLNMLMRDNNQEQLMSVLLYLYTTIGRSLPEPYVIHTAVNTTKKELRLKISLTNKNKHTSNKYQQKFNLDTTVTQLHNIKASLDHHYSQIRGNVTTVVLPYNFSLS